MIGVDVIDYFSSVIFSACLLAYGAFPDFEFCVISHFSIIKCYCFCGESNVFSLWLMVRFPHGGRKNPLSSVRRQWNLMRLFTSVSFARHVLQLGLGHFSGAHFSSWCIILQSGFAVRCFVNLTLDGKRSCHDWHIISL